MILTIISLMVGIALANADNWCEELVNQLNTTVDLDKTVTTSRDPGTHKLVHAVYDYKFKSRRLYNKIWNTLRQHASEAEFFSQKDYKKSKTILMRVNIDGQRWDCKLQTISKGKQFIVTLNGVQSDKSGRFKASKQKQRAVRQSRKARNMRVVREKQSQDDRALIIENNRELEKAAQERKRRLEK